MEQQRDVDVIVVGAGPAGSAVVRGALQAGLRTAVVESELVGGECHYWGCLPSKALLRPLDVYTAATRMSGVSAAVTGQVDTSAVFARRDVWVDHWDDTGSVAALSAAGALVFKGRGRLAGERQVQVAARTGESITLRASLAVVLATGATAAWPDIPGLRDVGAWTNREATSLDRVPASIVILGGGPIGSELATAYRRLGSAVTLLHTDDRLLPRLEPEAGDEVSSALRAEGVDVRLDVALSRVTRSDDASGQGSVRVELANGDVVDAEQIVVATGRHAATADLGLETVRLEPGAPLRVDASQFVEGVDGSWLLAIGDVAGAGLTHMGTYQARVTANVLRELARGEPISNSATRYRPDVATASQDAVSQVVFTDPQVASVGLTKAQADARGLPARKIVVPIEGVPGAGLHADGYRGVAGIVVDTERDVIVGATFVGPDVVDLLHSATIAVVTEASLDRLWHAVPPFPTISEVWVKLLDAALRPAA